MAVVTQTMQDNVTELYIGFFGRAPDAAGFGYWTNRLAVGDVTIQQISKAFAATPEFVSNYNGLTPTQQVTKVYQNVLNRAPDAGGLAYWVGQITSGAQTIADVVWNVTNSAFIQTGTADGLLVQNKVQVGEYFAITLASNDTASAATAYNLVTSNPASVAQAEATLVSATYTLTTSIETVNVEKNGAAIVGTQTTFQASDTISGNGHTNLQLNLTDSGTTAWTLPGATVNGVQTVKLQNVGGTAAVPATAQTTTITFTGYTYSTPAGSITIDGNTTSLGTTSLSASAVAALMAGQTYTNYTVTSFNSATATIVLTQKAAGVAAIPVISSSAGGGALTTPTQVVVQGTAAIAAATYTDTVDAANFVGMTTFVDNNSTGAVTVNNMTAAQTAQINGNGSVTNGNFTVNYKSTETGTATVNVSAGVRGAAVAVAGATGITATTVNSAVATNSLGGLTTLGSSLAINANSALSTGGITNNALTSIVVSGAAQNVTSTTGTSFNGKVAVDLGTLHSSVTTVDASGLTAGGVYVALNNGVVTSFKGGQGNDSVVVGNTTNSAASIDAGAGSDTLIVGATNDINTNGSKYLNFEVLQNNGTATLNASKIAGITAVITNGDGAGFTNLSAAQAGAVTLQATQTGGLTYALGDASGTADVLALTVTNSTPTTVVNSAALAIGGFETLNLTVSTGGTAIYNTNGSVKTAGTDFGSYAIGTATTDLKTVTVAGAYAAKVDVSANAVKVTTLDASQNTAGVNLKFAGQTGALVVTGSAAADYIEVGAKGTGGTVAVSTGAGNDTVIGSYANLAALSSLAGGLGTDTLSYSDTTSSVSVSDNSFANVTGIDKFVFANTSGALDWTVGGYANTLVSSTGGTLDIAAAALTAGLVVNAAGLTGSNLLKLNATATSDTGAITITSSTAGVDSITLATATARASGNTTIDASLNTSAGVTVDLTSYVVGAGTNVVKGGTGADTISLAASGTVAWSVTGGAGQDKITAGAGVDTITYTTKATSVGDAGVNVDTITSFTHGTDKVGLQGSATAGYLLNGVTLTSGTSTVNTMLAAVTDNTSVNSLADVYAAISANGYFGSGNFAATGTAAAANQIIAKQIVFANGSAAGSYLVVNDAIAGFQGANDLVIKIGVSTIDASDFSILA